MAVYALVNIDTKLYMGRLAGADDESQLPRLPKATGLRWVPFTEINRGTHDPRFQVQDAPRFVVRDSPFRCEAIFDTSWRVDIRDRVIRAINKVAEDLRMRNQTSGAVMQAVYREKLEQARAVQANPGMAPPPLIQAEMDATGKTKAQVVSGILSAHAEWVTAMAIIEKDRMTLFQTLKDLESPEERIEAVRTYIEQGTGSWPDEF